MFGIVEAILHLHAWTLLLCAAIWWHKRLTRVAGVAGSIAVRALTGPPEPFGSGWNPMFGPEPEGQSGELSIAQDGADLTMVDVVGGEVEVCDGLDHV